MADVSLGFRAPRRTGKEPVLPSVSVTPLTAPLSAEVHGLSASLRELGRSSALRAQGNDPVPLGRGAYTQGSAEAKATAEPAPPLELPDLASANVLLREVITRLEGGDKLSAAERASIDGTIQAVLGAPAPPELPSLLVKARFRANRLAAMLELPTPTPPAAPPPPPAPPLSSKVSPPTAFDFSSFSNKPLVAPPAVPGPADAPFDEASLEAARQRAEYLGKGGESAAALTELDGIFSRLLATPPEVAPQLQLKLDRAIELARRDASPQLSFSYVPHPHAPTKPAPARTSAKVELNEEQSLALAIARHFSEIRAKSSRKTLLGAFKESGLSGTDLAKALAYLANEAPLTINIDLARVLSPIAHVGDYAALEGLPSSPTPLDLLSRFDSYLNALEVGVSTGNPGPGPGGHRDNKLRHLFRGAYDASKNGVLGRPHYGAINFGRFTLGAAPAFGDCYFELKKDPALRSRVTVLPHDSNFCGPAEVGTLNNIEHILLDAFVSWKDADEQKKLLGCLMDGVAGKSAGTQPPFRIVTNPLKQSKHQDLDYLEIQVHGPIDFAHDVQRLVVSSKYKGTPVEAKVQAFADKFGIELAWHDATLVKPQALSYWG